MLFDLFTGALVTPTLVTAAKGYDLDLLGSGTIITSDTTFLNTGIITLGDAAGDTLTFTGGLDTTAALGGTKLAGTINTTNTAMDLGAATLTAATTLSSGTGNINVASVINGANTLTISNTGASTATISGVVSGDGGLIKNGTGTLVLNGTNTYIGGTTINAGVLDISGTGTVIRNVTLADGGTHTSALTIGTNTVTLGGAGVYAQAAGTTLNVTITDASSYGKIVATGGNAAVTGGTVNVTVGSSYIANGATFLIIDGAAGGDVSGLSITDNSFVLNFTGSSGLPDYTLTAVRTVNYATVSTNANEEAVGQTLDVISQQNPSGDMLDVLTTLDSMSSAQEMADSISTMVPDVSSGDVQGSKMMMGQLLTSVGQRLGFWRNGFAGGLATGDMFQGAGFWMQGMGSHANQGTRQGIEGFRANTFGTSIGVDKLLGRHGRIGLAGGYSYAAVHSKTPGSPSSGINSFQTTVYGSYDSTDLELGRKAAKNGGYIRPNRQWWYADGMLAFGANGYDSRRDISLGSETRTAKADHYGQQYSAKTELGYSLTFEKTKALEITPFTSLEYTYLYMNRYTETGADSLNLNVNGQGYNTLEQGLGLKFGYPIYKENWGTFVPSIKGAWLYDYISDMFQSTSSFVGGGPSFNSAGAHPSKNGFLTGLQLAFMNIGNMTLTANYDFTLRDQFLDQTYYLTARFDF